MLSSETVPLGRGKAFVVKKKSKFKPQKSGFCNSPSCLCEVQLDDKNQCLRCFNKVVQKQNYDSMKKWFDNFIKHNEHLLNFEMNYTAVIQVPIHKRVYYVPIRYFIEFQNLISSDDFIDSKDVAYQKFFGYVKKSCYSVILV